MSGQSPLFWLLLEWPRGWGFCVKAAAPTGRVSGAVHLYLLLLLLLRGLLELQSRVHVSFLACPRPPNPTDPLGTLAAFPYAQCRRVSERTSGPLYLNVQGVGLDQIYSEILTQF